ncbi:HAD family hydrolase [Paenibacillus senegalensis]|uniref:HAD family hydrolase n=1 Tax=Paenibacillus senegalensis TaxID=1465766 RepID=UPI00028A2011|nr:HAD family hydrolase [Paenibacillus senegalensis]
MGATVWFGEKETTIKCVAFDKDGTLFDAFGFWLYIDNLRKEAFASQVGEQYKEAWSRLMGITDTAVDHQGVLAVATTNEEIIMTAGLIYQLKAWPWVKCKQAAEEIFQTADKQMEIAQAFKKVEGVPDIFHKLTKAGIYTGILTSDSYARTEKCMELLEVQRLLDFIVTPEKVKNGKPAPDMVHTACQQLNIQPHEMAVIGDSVVDMKMAKQAGSLAVGIITYEGSEEVLAPEADVLITSINQIRIDPL